MRIFLAGSVGVNGRRLLPLLIEAGHQVTGTTRAPGNAKDIEAFGATAAVVDAFDALKLADAVRASRPDVVFHQLTDLPDSVGSTIPPAAAERNARIRIEATRNLVVAARSAGVARLIAQSIAFVYAAGFVPAFRRRTDGQ